jgi:hypothetical protein
MNMRKGRVSRRFPAAFVRRLGFCLIFLWVCREALAQGPAVSYYYHPQTQLSWAECSLHLKGGSRQKIPFLPVIVSGIRNAPFGVGDYAKDIRVDGPVVFAGDGIFMEGVRNSYSGRRADYSVGKLDVSGSIVVFCGDEGDSATTKYRSEFPLSRRISEAAGRNAAAVVVFSSVKEFPFLKVGYERENEIPDIPVITVTKSSILNILASAGLDGEGLMKTWAETGTPPESQVLISRLSIEIKGRFDGSETENFLFRYPGGSIPEEQMDELARTNERSLPLLRKVFGGEEDLRWRKLRVYYFSDYDTKVFYTHHWGLGLATEAGTYMVYAGGAPDFPLTVHENAHILIDRNWGGSSSFLNEGIGKFAEVQAGERDENDRQVLGFIKAGKLLPLKDLVGWNIGTPGPKTDVGYPAAGSFVGFLVGTRGLKALKETFLQIARSKEGPESDAPWIKALGKPLAQLERDWLNRLAHTHPADAEAVRAYLKNLME